MELMTCVKCGKEKKQSDFYLRKRQLSNGSLKMYPRRDCKECSSQRYKNWIAKEDKKISNRATQKAWVKNNPDRCTNARLKYRFGITLEQYNLMLQEQSNKCAICGITEKDHTLKMKNKFHVDHCHSTGLIRGLLCNNCNVSLGGFKDSKEILECAIKYLTDPPAHATLRLVTAGDECTHKEPTCLRG
jgi:hypothetical protein